MHLYIDHFKRISQPIRALILHVSHRPPPALYSISALWWRQDILTLLPSVSLSSSSPLLLFLSFPISALALSRCPMCRSQAQQAAGSSLAREVPPVVELRNENGVDGCRRYSCHLLHSSLSSVPSLMLLFVMHVPVNVTFRWVCPTAGSG